ncbi:Rieske (2Fe-2S) protein [Pseudonocardia sp. KRD291]|uniref:Rieske (2Fe-2S) protein n=1 Tax=Pseudonocardia sp. KRD291 TaxID=2792007 RepID=UPI001C49DF6C|nr:Rieske (2Fe-2S) protein [Pseudonocardia sp. KRD291]MBW0101020.1 Rieske (2Fe-2S) protein [Pseudonocardia sp. KRD291]
MSNYVVARCADIAEGERVIVDIDGRSVGVFNVGGRFYAFLNHCPHQGAELCRGDIVGAMSSRRPGEYEYAPDRKYLTCPWHGWEFDIETGQSYFDPGRTRIRPYRVAVEAGRDVLAGQDGAGDVGADGRRPGPYVADTLTVRVEDDYVVVETRR